MPTTTSSSHIFMPVDSAHHKDVFISGIMNQACHPEEAAGSPGPGNSMHITDSKWAGRGFTLVELLLAIAISVVIVGTVYVTFYQSHKVTTTIMSQTEVYQMARLVMDRMMKDLNCIYFSPYLVLDSDLKGNEKANELAQKYRFIGKSENDGTNDTDKIYFTTTSDIGLSDQTGIVNEVDYELVEDPDNKGLYFLVRRESNKPHDGIMDSSRNEGMELAENVVSMNILYYDKSGKESEEWDALSTSTPSLPYLIKITLKLKSGKDIYEFTSVASPVMTRMQSLESEDNK